MVAGVKILDDVDDIILISQEGILIRMHAVDIPMQSRYGSGVRVMRVGEGDKVAVLARTAQEEDAEVSKPEVEADEELTAEEQAALEAAEAAETAAEQTPADDE